MKNEATLELAAAEIFSTRSLGFAKNAIIRAEFHKSFSRVFERVFSEKKSQRTTKQQRLCDTINKQHRGMGMDGVHSSGCRMLDFALGRWLCPKCLICQSDHPFSAFGLKVCQELRALS